MTGGVTREAEGTIDWEMLTWKTVARLPVESVLWWAHTRNVRF